MPVAQKPAVLTSLLLSLFRSGNPRGERVCGPIIHAGVANISAKTPRSGLVYTRLQYSSLETWPQLIASHSAGRANALGGQVGGGVGVLTMGRLRSSLRSTSRSKWPWCISESSTKSIGGGTSSSSGCRHNGFALGEPGAIDG
jgi:hypothetical protein